MEVVIEGLDPSAGGVRKRGQLGVVKCTILSPQDLPLIGLKAQLVNSGSYKFTPSILCRPEVCHFTPKNSSLSWGVANQVSAKHPGAFTNDQLF